MIRIGMIGAIAARRRHHRGGGGGGTGFIASITIDHTKCGSADTTNFPMLVSLSNAKLKTVANGGAAGTNGYDIQLWTSSAHTTKLDWQTIKWDGSAGTWLGWVRVPTLTHSSDAVIYVTCGDTTVTTDQSNPTGVWRSSFKRVFHLDDGSTLSGADSTSNAANLTNASAAATGSAKVNGGVNFNPGSMNGSNTGMPSPAGAWTYAFWWNNSNGFAVGRLLSFYDGTNSLQIGSVNGGAFIAWGNPDGGDVNPVQALTTNDPGGLEMIVFTSDGAGGYKVYLNGSDVSQETYFSGDLTLFNGNSTTLYLGQRGNGSGINAICDEMMIENAAMTASEALARYNNQNAPTSFITVGTFTAY